MIWLSSLIATSSLICRDSRRPARAESANCFTIYDFVKAYEHLNDPEWDGEPMEPQPAKRRQSWKKEVVHDGHGDVDEPERPQKIKIRLADGKERTIQCMMATSYWSPDGR